MLFQCWASVADGGPTLKYRWVNVSWDPYNYQLTNNSSNHQTTRQLRSGIVHHEPVRPGSSARIFFNIFLLQGHVTQKKV